jgi:toxin ParE1/3/4
MADYRLTQAAKEDLVQIARYGDENFGALHSNEYRDKLKLRFAAIAKRPLLYPSVEHIKDGYRRSVCGQHSIYYRFTDDVVEIIRVLNRQNI